MVDLKKEMYIKCIRDVKILFLMAELIEATDLIGLSLGMETYQVITFKFREIRGELNPPMVDSQSTLDPLGYIRPYNSHVVQIT